MKNICMDVCNDFLENNFVKDIDPTTNKTSYNIIKHPNGKWQKTTKNSFHEPAVLSDLDFSKMPNLLELIKIIEETDKDLKNEGGRIFISEFHVYKLKKGKQTTLIHIENTEIIDGPYRLICDEFINNSISRDRYRSEETYIINRQASEWFVQESHENHKGSRIILDLKKMILFKNLSLKLIKKDSKLRENGGRIFITPTRIYRLNNKIEQIIII